MSSHLLCHVDLRDSSSKLAALLWRVGVKLHWKLNIHSDYLCTSDGRQRDRALMSDIACCGVAAE